MNGYSQRSALSQTAPVENGFLHLVPDLLGFWTILSYHPLKTFMLVRFINCNDFHIDPSGQTMHKCVQIGRNPSILRGLEN